MKVKGMRNLATVQTLRNHARPSSRAEMAAQLARLEHERFRLEREMQIFEEKRANSAETLQQIQTQLDQLREALYSSDAEQDRKPRRTAEEKGRDDATSQATTKKVKSVTLQY